MHVTHLVKTGDYGHVLQQLVFAYEMQFSTDPAVGGKWRNHHRVLVIAASIDEAIAITRIQYPANAVIHQIVCRSKEMPLLISESALMPVAAK